MISAISCQKDMQMLNVVFNTVFASSNKNGVGSYDEIIGDFPRTSSREGFHFVSRIQ